MTCLLECSERWAARSDGPDDRPFRIDVTAAPSAVVERRVSVEFILGLTASAPTAALGEGAMSDFLDSIPTWIYLFGGAIVVLLVVWVVFKSVWKVAEPDEALILSGLSGRNTATAEGLDFKIVTGKGTVVLPGLQTVRSLKLSLYETALGCHLRDHSGHSGHRPRGGDLQDR